MRDKISQFFSNGREIIRVKKEENNTQKENRYFEWTKIKRTENIQEAIFGIIALVVICCGLIVDAMNNPLGPTITNFQNVSLVVLQIQITLSTISIALITLFSGFISKEYQGVSVTNYFFNIKPSVLKQKTIICGLLVLDAFNILIYLYHKYNTVIAVAWSSIVIIVFSAIELFEIFKGKEKIEHEINAYTEYILLYKNISYRVKVRAFNSFTQSWANDVLDSVEYDDYMSKYKKSITSLLDKNVNDGLAVLNKNSINLVKRQHSIQNKSGLYKAYELFEETYNTVWMYILDHGLIHINNNFDLYEECIEEIVETLCEMSVEHFNKKVFWKNIVDNIIRVNIYCNKNKTIKKPVVPDITLKRVDDFIYGIGDALLKRNNRGEDLNSNNWVVDSSPYFYNYNIPKNIEHDYMIWQCEIHFLYYCVLIKKGLGNYTEKIFDEKEYLNDNAQHENTLYKLLVFCYVYYLGKREEIDCIFEHEKIYANSILEKWKQNTVFVNFVSELNWTSEYRISPRLLKDLNSILERYERLPKHGVKTCIMGKTVFDFYIYFLAMVFGIGFEEIIIDEVLDNDQIKNIYYTHFRNNYEKTKTVLEELNKTFNSQDDSGDILESGLSRLNSEVASKYKEVMISETNKVYDELSDPEKMKKLADDLKKTTQEIIIEGTKDWFKKPQNANYEKEYSIFSLIIDLEKLDSDTIRSLKINIEHRILLLIIDELSKKGIIMEYIREDDEDKYIELVAKSSLLIGSDYAVHSLSYEKRKEFDDLIFDKHIKRIPFGTGAIGLILDCKNLLIEVKNIEIELDNVSLEDINYEFDEKTGLFSSNEVSDGYVEMTKEELEEYLFKKKIKVKMSVKLNYQLPNNMIGYKVIRKTRDEYE